MARDAVCELKRCTGGCDWGNLDVMGDLVLSEYLDSRHIGTFHGERLVGRVFVNGKGQMTM